MSIINSILQKLRLRENNYGLVMVVIAYAVSAALLIFGSDALYDIRTRAEMVDRSIVEETEQELQTNRIIAGQLPEGVILPLSAYSLALEHRVVYGEIQPAGTEPQQDQGQAAKAEAKQSETETEVSDISNSVKEDALQEMEEQQDSEEVPAEKEKEVIYSLTEEEVGMLQRIVEAEAGGEDIKGKILVANVIFNRIEEEEFPDTVKDVIFQKVGGSYQFSPILDKRYWKVKVSSESKEAVERALEGEDYSKGALYFLSRKDASSKNIKWFDRELKRLFKYGTHEFFTNK